jgi:hypothetical protein
MTPAAGIFLLLCTAVPLAAFMAFPSRWRYWRWALLPLPLSGALLSPLFDPILVASLTPAAIAALGPMIMVVLDDRERSGPKRWPWVLLLVLLLFAALVGFSMAGAHVSFKGQSEFCWASEIGQSPCRLNPYLVAGAYLGYTALPIISLGAVAALVTLVVYGLRRQRVSAPPSAEPPTG